MKKKTKSAAPMDRPFTPLEKLAIAGYAAARIRGTRVRKITTVDADGRPVRVIDSDEMQGKLLQRQGIEFDAKGMIECVACGRKYPRRRSSGQPVRLCGRCLREAKRIVVAPVACVDCGTMVSKYTAARVYATGQAARCKGCSARAAQKLIPSAKRAAIMKRIRAGKTRADNLRAGAKIRKPPPTCSCGAAVSQRGRMCRRCAAAQRDPRPITVDVACALCGKAMAPGSFYRQKNAGKAPAHQACSRGSGWLPKPNNWKRAAAAAAKRAADRPEALAARRSLALSRAWATRRANAAKAAE